MSIRKKRTMKKWPGSSREIYEKDSFLKNEEKQKTNDLKSVKRAWKKRSIFFTERTILLNEQFYWTNYFKWTNNFTEHLVRKQKKPFLWTIKKTERNRSFPYERAHLYPVVSYILMFDGGYAFVEMVRGPDNNILELFLELNFDYSDLVRLSDWKRPNFFW